MTVLESMNRENVMERSQVEDCAAATDSSNDKNMLGNQLRNNIVHSRLRMLPLTSNCMDLYFVAPSVKNNIAHAVMDKVEVAN